MQWTTFVLAGFLLISLSCARQPAPAPAPTVITEPTDPRPTTPPNPDPVREADQADRATEIAREQAEAMEEGRETVPSREEAAEQIRRRRTRRTEQTVVIEEAELSQNETALIENQGNVGNASLTPSDDDEPDPDAEIAPTMTYRKSACYGDCETYTLRLLETGEAILDVSSGLDGEGHYTDELNRLEYRELMVSVDSVRAVDLAENYPIGENPPADAQFRELSFLNEEDELDRVRVYYAAPPVVERFMDRLDEMVRERYWRRVDSGERK